jgi:hypothetical protein
LVVPIFSIPLHYYFALHCYSSSHSFCHGFSLFLMKNVFFTAIFLTAFAYSNTTHAQLLSVKTDDNKENAAIEVLDKTKDDAVFADAENKAVYIDFEKISVNLSEIVLKNAKGEILLDDTHVADMPVNQIYELDCAKLPAGKYSLEMKSFIATERKRSIIIR